MSRARNSAILTGGDEIRIEIEINYEINCSNKLSPEWFVVWEFLGVTPCTCPSIRSENIHPSASIRWRMAATCAGQLLFILTICEAGRWTFSWITQSSCHGWLPANVAYCFATFFPHPWSKSRGSCTCRWPPMTMTAMMTPPRFNSPGETLPLPHPHPLRLRWVGGSTVRWFSGCCCYASFRFHYKARVPQLPL